MKSVDILDHLLAMKENIMIGVYRDGLRGEKLLRNDLDALIKEIEKELVQEGK